jgi:LPXTG-site transpeptidase (sortase) family protein
MVMKHIHLHRVNTVLLGLIVAVNLYIIAAPFTPGVVFWWQSNHSNRQATLRAQVHKAPTANPAAPAVQQANTLTVPSMLLNTPVLEGSVANTYKTLAAGIWHWPLGSSPDKGGNTVIVGHRFTYTNPRGIFYFLNKVRLGDEIGLVWNQKNYIYKVSSIAEVPPTDITITTNTTDARLTLYTCTPLWNPKNRLVVVAELEKNP